MRELRITQAITISSTDSIFRYLNELSKINLLNNEEEVHLAKKIKEGDLQALEKLVTSNLRFVVSVAKKYTGRGVSFADLISEGNLGLIQAAKRFDETRGFKFISFAVWHIRQSIIIAIGNHERSVRLPINIGSYLSILYKCGATLEQRLERIPTVEELAMEAKMDIDKVKYWLKVGQQEQHLMQMVNEESGFRLIDALEDSSIMTIPEIINENSLKMEIENVLSHLPHREQMVLKRLFGVSFETSTDMEALADEMGISKERLRQLRERAFEKIRSLLHVDRLKSYL
ncbi:RNA polymerase sigma factor RpoD/SigA [Pedobacter sp.]|jgi:RNA polymerase primary sigma factor|uniref:sigma-70 family RNA polymerase sigma factor n=1 Tax=Pedobacter sp. TaxID=1411316 RepID=UPI002D165DB8|nr:RNA polymerase sigma factor RpoD/SigA [Pedobacter sp.]HWW37843.1 RNA polymerase sigma factor RpoD/SigA [Pedobacter sp.]